MCVCVKARTRGHSFTFYLKHCNLLSYFCPGVVAAQKVPLPLCRSEFLTLTFHHLSPLTVSEHAAGAADVTLTVTPSVSQTAAECWMCDCDAQTNRYFELTASVSLCRSCCFMSPSFTADVSFSFLFYCNTLMFSLPSRRLWGLMPLCVLCILCMCLVLREFYYWPQVLKRAGGPERPRGENRCEMSDPVGLVLSHLRPSVSAGCLSVWLPPHTHFVNCHLFKWNFNNFFFCGYLSF